MPTYPVKNNKTGEEKDFEYDHCMIMSNGVKTILIGIRIGVKGCASAQEVGDWQNKLISRNPGWNDVLGKAAKAPGSTVKKI